MRYGETKVPVDTAGVGPLTTDTTEQSLTGGTLLATGMAAWVIVSPFSSGVSDCVPGALFAIGLSASALRALASRSPRTLERQDSTNG